MSFIRVKREDQPIQISDESVAIIAEATDKYIKTKEDTLMKIGGNFIRASDVIAIKEEKKPKKETTEDTDDYYEDRKINLRRPVEVRAQETFWFEFLFDTIYHKQPTEEQLQHAREVNLKFYIANPLRQFVNPVEYKIVFEDDPKLGKYVYSLVERIIQTDVHYSKYKV